MGSVTSNWVTCEPGPSKFNPTMALHSRIYKYLCAFVPPQRLYSIFLSVNIHEKYFATETTVRGQDISQFDKTVMMYLKSMLHSENSYISSLQIILEWTVAEEAPGNYRIVIHA